MTTRLDVSIGPVQGFVSQSRRTRDLWGSSYLLSFLSAHAMRGAEEAGGRIVRPLVERDQLYQWVKGRRNGDPPQIGSLPNHFVVEVSGCAADVARSAKGALATAWLRVHEAVWCEFVIPAEASGSGTRSIWDRQVDAFWEIAWTAAPRSEDPANKRLLARRKHWRDHRPPDEPGDKCTVMHDLQELSGYVRSEGTQSRGSQEHFWCDVRKHAGRLDLRENERLCAVALTKRFFPKIAKEALGWEVARGHWPSTVHVAAVPWIRRVATEAPDPARSYADAVKDHAPEGVLAERRSPSGTAATEAGDFAGLDANWFHRESVDNKSRCPLRDEHSDDDVRSKEIRTELKRKLREIAITTDTRNASPFGTPAKYYALLLADGDRLGKLVGELGGRKVGRALADFTGSVQSIVAEDHDGVTVYAGGDDVMAMLPLPTAIRCAEALSRRYQKAFADTSGVENGATLSAAVVFAHVIRSPLSSVIRRAHRLLDDVAKDGNGRNSLAVGVLKPGGMYCQWVTTWVRQGVSAQVGLDRLTEHLGETGGDPGLSSSLVYRARKTLAMLCGWNRWEPGTWGDVPEGLDVEVFLRAEIARSLASQGTDRTDQPEASSVARQQQAVAISEAVCDLLGRSHAEATGDGSVGVDALMLARFLADGGQQDDVR